MKKFNTGSTLIELIIAVMVVGLITTAIANAVTHSVKNTGEARYKQVATALGQEVMEFIRSEKNRLGIVNLKNTLLTDDYCFSTIPDNLDSTPISGECDLGQPVTMAETDFFRNVIIVNSGSGGSADPYKTHVVVTVSWYDGPNLKEIELIQEFQEAN